MSAIKFHDTLTWPQAAKADKPTNKNSGNILPIDLLSVFHEYCQMDECIKLSIAGRTLSPKIITKSINAACKAEFANFVAYARVKHESDFNNFQKIIDVFFQHAPTKAQAHFFSYMTNRDDDFLTDIISELPRDTAHLNLTNCKWLRDHHVEGIVGRLNNLQSMNFSNCRFLTDRAVMAIVGFNTASLKSLNFMRCHRLTNAALMAIANSSNMANLQSLKFAWCRHITDTGAAAISNSSMTKLRTVNLRGCTVTATARAAIANMLRQNTQ